MRRLAVLPALFLTLLASACATGGSSSPTARSNSDIIGLEELRSVETVSAYDAISRLRPRWLRSRVPGQDPVVMMNGSQLGGLDVLRNVQVSMLTEIRYRNGRDATTLYGTGFGGGTIEMKSQG